MVDPGTELKLLRRTITLEDAREEDENILKELRYPGYMKEFYIDIILNKQKIESAVANHLNIDPEDCELSHAKDWMHGSFNLCMPIKVTWRGYSKVLLRIPLPYKVGESENPGNIDEKLRCEVATYVYIQRYCPEIRIPMLWGFGFKDGSKFTSLSNSNIIHRLFRNISDGLRYIFGYPSLAPFIQSSWAGLDTGYLLLEYIEDGEMLSKTFNRFKDDQTRKKNLFRGLSRIMLSLGKVPHSRIGSFTFSNNGHIQLSNRPLTLRLQALENEGIPTGLDRSTTFSSVMSYYRGLLSYHDQRLLYQPNSIYDEMDGKKQMAALGLMRSFLSHFVYPQTQHGPFILTLTDLHQSNIFVDDEWRITCLIDLEWACTLPIEMQHPPYWITGRDVDCLTEKEYEHFQTTYEEFLSIFEEEQLTSGLSDQKSQLVKMRENLHRGMFWCHYALDTTQGFYNLFIDHILPRVSPCLPFESLWLIWDTNASTVLQTKLADRQDYLEKLEQVASTV